MRLLIMLFEVLENGLRNYGITHFDWSCIFVIGFFFFLWVALHRGTEDIISRSLLGSKLEGGVPEAL